MCMQGGVNMADVFEQFFGQNPAFARAFNQFTTPPVRLSFEVRTRHGLV